MTMGEGGAVYTNQPLLNRIVRSFRDWGRDCWCDPGHDGTCRHRYDGQYGELPVGYDHKYVYSHFGYNLKATDMQCGRMPDSAEMIWLIIWKIIIFRREICLRETSSSIPVLMRCVKRMKAIEW